MSLGQTQMYFQLQLESVSSEVSHVTIQM